ncbi:uncharacterized protein [Macrobrachium rosenbergii]|uniref:uncharacterized protein n=1 Tax=Macrobrachium rosenbergii TaxID=79674 RepID=UPI0034D6E5D0
MKNENVLKTPQLLTRSKKRTDDETPVQEKENEGSKSLRIQSFSHRDAFGWGFPKVEDYDGRKKNVIDLNWLNDYNDEIDKLQVVIKKERSLSFNSQCENLLEQRPSSRNAGSELEESLDSTHSFEIELPNALERQGQQKGLVKSDSLLLQVNNNNNNEELLSSTPSADAFCSIRSCPSRDSGISATDDISDPLPEIHIDRSILAELEGISEDEQLESTDTVGALSLDKGKVSDEQSSESGDLTEGLIGDVQRKCPVWYKKFSIGHNDLILNFDSLNWGFEPECEDEISCMALVKDEQYDSLISRSDKESNVDDSVDEVECVDERRRQRIKDLWSICDRLEASSLRGGRSLKGLSEIMELVASFSKIDSRLEILKCDLQSLSRQATENRHEFNSLQKRASNLLTSTESSRHHMAQLFCLERLEERLQEEWWGAHYPDLVKLNESYIV